MTAKFRHTPANTNWNATGAAQNRMVLNYKVVNHAPDGQTFSIAAVPTGGDLNSPSIEHQDFAEIPIRGAGHTDAVVLLNGNLIAPNETIAFKASSTSVVLIAEGYQERGEFVKHRYTPTDTAWHSTGYVQPANTTAHLNYKIINHDHNPQTFNIAVVPTGGAVGNPDIQYQEYPNMPIDRLGNKTGTAVLTGNIVTAGDTVAFKASSPLVVMVIEGYQDIEGSIA